MIANGLEQVEQFLLYSCDGLIDAKQLIFEVFIKQSATLDEARERLKESLLHPVSHQTRHSPHTPHIALHFILAASSLFGLLRQRSTMETHGSGLSLHVRLGDSACDFTNFCAPKLFPAEVFGGPARWNDEEARRSLALQSRESSAELFRCIGTSRIRWSVSSQSFAWSLSQKDPTRRIGGFKRSRLILEVVSSRFTINEAREHLADKLPYFQDAACHMPDFWQLSEKCLPSRTWPSSKSTLTPWRESV